MEHCIFYVQTERGPLSFDAGPENIVVTVGKQLEGWSHGVFKCVPGEMIFMPSFQSSPASFSIELVCLASSNDLSHSLNNSDDCDNIISLADQIIVVQQEIHGVLGKIRRDRRKKQHGTPFFPVVVLLRWRTSIQDLKSCMLRLGRKEAL
ncbi:hypothetical protein JHK85_026986 [Glycine max]|nr:hypothetical protein JHK85_026986 [Glycine max]